MKLEKGNIIKQTRRNAWPHPFMNCEHTLVIERVNKNSYSLKCIEGPLKDGKFKLKKDFAEKSVDKFGTVTEYTLVR